MLGQNPPISCLQQIAVLGVSEMESSKSSEVEKSINESRKTPFFGYLKIRSLIRSFEEEKIIDKRYAIVGMLLLLAVLPGYLLYDEVTDYFISPDYIVVATLVNLYEAQIKKMKIVNDI